MTKKAQEPENEKGADSLVAGERFSVNTPTNEDVVGLRFVLFIFFPYQRR